MPVDLPPVSRLESIVNEVATEFGVQHPPLLDQLVGATSTLGNHGCLRLHVVAGAEHADVGLS